MIKYKSGLTTWEVVLFILMLAIAGGTSVFFFFLNSKDVKIAEKKYEWIKNTNKILDEITLELANCIELEHPFEGESSNCLFRKAKNSSSQDASSVINGFDFVDGKLIYFAKNDSTKTKKVKFNSRENPIILSCYDGKFIRQGPAKLLLSFSLREPDNSGNKRKFTRVVYLRNK